MAYYIKQDANTSFLQNDIEYLKSKKFRKLDKGNSGLYGLNFLGSNSIIEFKDKIWKFVYWEIGTNIACYINVNSEILSFNPYNKDLDIYQMIETDYK
jgi:hypothetical protein